VVCLWFHCSSYAPRPSHAVVVKKQTNRAARHVGGFRSYLHCQRSIYHELVLPQEPVWQAALAMKYTPRPSAVRCSTAAHRHNGDVVENLVALELPGEDPDVLLGLAEELDQLLLLGEGLVVVSDSLAEALDLAPSIHSGLSSQSCGFDKGCRSYASVLRELADVWFWGCCRC
jgi:hypothetical protein